MQQILDAISRGATWSVTITDIEDYETGTTIAEADLEAATWKVELFNPDAMQASALTIEGTDITVLGDGMVQWTKDIPTTMEPATYFVRVRAVSGAVTTDIATFRLPVLP